MTPELARALERSTQIRNERLKTVQDTHAETLAARRAQTGTLSAGDRVFDLLTGQEGTVLHGITENVIVPTPER